MIMCILGRQPAIGLAELEALYGTKAVRPAGDSAALVDVDEIDFARLGGSIKAAQVYEILPGTNPQKAFLWLQKNIAELVGPVDGKLKLGVSLYGLSMPVNKLNANVLSLKKVLRVGGLSVRTVPNTEPALSSAQTYHNKLTGDLGCEILLVRDGNSTVVARATDVQDIDGYTLRDRGRPKRDAFVGMLPPKLAQTIINLAASTKTDGVLLDPFCGTGVVLQEALLMGYGVYGTDLQQRMIDYSQKNLDWLKTTPAGSLHSSSGKDFAFPAKRGKTDDQLAPSESLEDDGGKASGVIRLEQGDATDHIWRQPVDIVACEGYLGQPLGGQNPTVERLEKIINECDVITRGFLENIGKQLKSGTRLCLALPAWFVGGKIYRLSSLDDLEKLGYTRIDFVHATSSDLIYRREDQVVGRELVVITRK